MREGYTQGDAFLGVTTSLGPEKLLLNSFWGTEALSELFHFTLTMRSEDGSIQGSAVVGTSATVKLQQVAGPSRFFNGIISRFTYLGSAVDFALYSAELVPRMWLLTLGRDRVIYQNQTVPDIIKAVLGEFGVAFQAADITGSYTAREYCVRYDETAFDFISRLMEDEGIFYWFTFSDGAHTLVLADSKAAYTTCPNMASLVVRSEGDNFRRVDSVTQFELERRLVALSHAVDDFNYMTPSTDLFAQSDGASGRGLDYEYPGRHLTTSSGQKKAQVRVQEHQVEHLIGKGTSHCHHLLAGTTFTLAEHVRADVNVSYLVRRVQHRVDRGTYVNNFEVLLATEQFRAPRITPHPVVFGDHTAKVVGSSGEEIWTDAHGRIKIQFPWDRKGKSDESSSCWIRVSQAWAGQGWGALYIPRIGQEVIVSYLDGDPDRPYVSGRVYNAEQTTPIKLPSLSSQSTVLSRSTKKGSAGNEMRFEDKKDSEELYLHAQKDMRAEIENDLTTTVIAGSELHTVKKGDRTVKVDTGNEVHSVKGTRALEVTGDETHTNKANFTHKVTGNYELKVTGNLVIDVTGSIKIKSAMSVDVEAGTNLTNKAAVNLKNEAGVGLTNKGGATLTNESVMVSNKASAMQTVDGGGLLVAKAGLVKIN